MTDRSTTISQAFKTFMTEAPGHARAYKELGIPINVVDDPELSTVIFPAVWREKSLLLAVSTEGIAPFMAAEIRTQMAHHARGMGRWVEIAGAFREIVRREIKDMDERQRLYKQFVDSGQPTEESIPPSGNARLSDWLLWLDGIRKLHE